MHGVDTMPIYKKCRFCSECLAKYPEDVHLMIYPVTMAKCPRCKDVEFTEIVTDSVPRYPGAPVVVKKAKTLF